MTTLSVKDEQGQPVKGWSFGAFRNVTNCGLFPRPARRISGWQLNSPDGVERFSEGNWQQFVPFALRIIGNYGCSTHLS
jgi:hypothetical protein